MSTPETFLGGQVIVRQPERGFRAGLDAVMLAAAVPACSSDEVLELGAGAGTACLCLAHRVGGVSVGGIEIDPELVKLANENAAANAMADRVRFITADVFALPEDFRRPFRHVLCNPPFHDAAGETAPDPVRARALKDDGKFAGWLTAGLKRTLSGGTFTAILRADRLGEALAALPDRGVSVFPLWPRAGEAAKRVLVRARQGSRAPLQLAAGLVLHQNDGRYTAEADAVLRGEALAL